MAMVKRRDSQPAAWTLRAQTNNNTAPRRIVGSALNIYEVGRGVPRPMPPSLTGRRRPK